MARAGEAFRCEAEQLPYGKEREELLHKARQLETASHVNEWLSSPGLAPSAGARSGTWLKSGSRAPNLFGFFTRRLEAFYDCPPEVPIAIVPDDGSWMAVMSAKVRTRYPHWARRVEGIQKQLREIYVLKD
jgi:hypothetical protein